MNKVTTQSQSSAAPFQHMDFPSEEIRSRETRRKTVSFVKILLDLFSLAAVLTFWLVLKNLAEPVRRGFLCNDLTLYHKQAEKKVFPSWLLFVCAFIIPLILIIASEIVRWIFHYRKRAQRLVFQLNFCSKLIEIPDWIGNLYITIVIFLFASGVNVVLTNIGKVTVGRPRPHFIATCFNQTSFQTFCTQPNQWITDYRCIGESSSISSERSDAFDSRQSFPSGHASTAFCGLIFLALYIGNIWKNRNFGLLPIFVQMMCFALAAYIGITRVTDYRHHPSDVISGAILGTAVAIIAFRYLIYWSKRAILPTNTTDSLTF